MAEFDASLEDLYLLAEAHPGFIWRIPDGIAADQLQVLNFDERISATVSVWDTVEALKDYTFESLHGDYLKRAGEWFEAVDGPQLVIWNVDQTNRPSFREAFNRLEILKRDGPTDDIYGWPS
jgi:hypothetical protein